MAELVHRQRAEKRMQKQIGCMSSFLHIFDRQQILARKRIHSTKRLPRSTSVGASPETVSSGESQEFCQELEKLEQEHNLVVLPESPDRSHSQSSRTENENDQIIFPGKCSKEMQSKATFDGDNNQRRPPSVVARLMGLESLSSYNNKTQQMVMTTPKLPRSGSESRILRDPVHSKYIDGNNFQVKHPNQSHNHSVECIVKDEGSNMKSECSRTTMNEELEKRLKIRGMDEQFNDLYALKQILEVLQLKGLLHSTNSSDRDSNRNFVYDPNLLSNESSIHLKQQWGLLASKVDQHRSVNKRFKREARAVDRSLRIPGRAATILPNRIECNLKSCNSIIKRKPLNIDIERRSVALTDSSTSPIASPKLTPKKTHYSITNRSPRNLKLTESSSVNSPKQNFIKNIVTDNESSSISINIVNSPSPTNSERSEWEDCGDGKRLLERCGKLLHSIAEMNNATESPPSSAAVLPSPVSVLDPGFDKDESSSPSHSIDFKASSAVDFEEDKWTTEVSPTQHNEHEEFISDDSDFIYISKILQASQHLRDDSTDFFSIDKHLYDYENTSDVCKISKCHQKLVFDVIIEILNRNRQLPPWKTSIRNSGTSVKHIWNEFLKIRGMIINTGDDIDLLELITSVLKKEVEIKDRDDYPIETSEVILDVERLIFKDLVGEAIGDFVYVSGECVFSRTRRKLVF